MRNILRLLILFFYEATFIIFDNMKSIGCINMIKVSKQVKNKYTIEAAMNLI